MLSLFRNLFFSNAFVTLRRTVLWLLFICRIGRDLKWLFSGLCHRFIGSCCLHHGPDDGSSKYLWNVGKLPMQDSRKVYLHTTNQVSPLNKVVINKLMVAKLQITSPFPIFVLCSQEAAITLLNPVYVFRTCFIIIVPSVTRSST